MVAVIGEVTGRQLRFEEVPSQFAAQGLIAHGLPEPFVTASMERYERGAGRPAQVTDEVEQILGRPALTFRSGGPRRRACRSDRGVLRATSRTGAGDRRHA